MGELLPPEDLPPGARDAARRSLARAIRIAGGAEELAGFLGVPLHDVQSWMDGTRRTPPRVFLALLDLVARDGLSSAALSNLQRRPDFSWKGPERRRA